MTLQVFSAGFGRTGTMSLKLGLQELGFGPCHHMLEVVENGAEQVPMWNAAHDGQADFDAIYKGYRSAVDWPTAAFWRELSEHYPDAKIILSSRSAESWYDSFSQTILAVLMDEDNWPAPAVEWFKMAGRICIDRSLGGKTDKESMIAAFNAHEAEVKAVIPANNLLVHEAKEGWPSLCAFLGVPEPVTPYPRTHSKDEFFVSMQKADDM
ncbi:MAG: sulfotransferase family protein [Acidimicrobiales bacterium]|nr:sulfotransferase family protein [Hyphomonadaceae bacterium]RZV35497.1 MAG: sulfotransferase family protein [Acidimicrobiales bacterium]